jgi:hypothetical protein
MSGQAERNRRPEGKRVAPAVLVRADGAGGLAAAGAVVKNLLWLGRVRGNRPADGDPLWSAARVPDSVLAGDR